MLNIIVTNFINSIKGAAPISIIIDIIIGIVLLILGLVLLSKNSESKVKRIGGKACVVISIIAFLGAISNWAFSYFI